MMDATQMDKFLNQYPNAIDIEDSDGMHVIHKAVQQRNIASIQILLNHHADLDATSNTGQTPLMLACYYAYLDIMHLLIQTGANTATVDNAGCGLIHYAVNGGQVAAVHYLTEVCGLSTHVRDHQLQTPLFKACSMGHIDMLNYLLRKERSEITVEDAVGNTALHIAAKKSHSWTCWRLLEKGGLGLLHKMDKDSLIPLDVAIKNATFKNSQAVKMLRHYSSLGTHTGHVTGPLLSWYCHLLMPFAGYLAIFMVIQFTNYRGLIATVLLLGLLKSIQCHQPRMLSYCRWPDPVYVGMFAAGLFYTVVCLYHELFANVYMRFPLFLVMYTCQLIAMVTVYYKLITSCPGLCTSSAVDDHTGQVQDILDVAKGHVSIINYCPVCEIIKPKNVHHCRLCDCCIYEMDHHCLMMNKCIGRGNHGLFVLFLFMCIITMSVFMWFSIWHLYYEFSIFIVDAKDIMLAIFNYYIFVWTMLLGNSVSLGWCCGMLLSQLWMIFNGDLIAYKTSPGTKQTYWQCINNLVAFVLGNRVQQDVCQAWPTKPDISAV